MSKEDNKFASNDHIFATLGIINSWISNTDSKISFMLAFLGVLSGFIFNSGLPQAYQSIGSIESIDNLSGGQIIGVILVTSLYMLLVLSCFKFLSALTAKLKGTNSNLNHSSLFFFGSISNHSLEVYTNKYLELTEEEAMKQVLEQVYTNSEICTQKLKDYNDGMKFTKWMTAIWFVCSIFQLL